MSLFNRLYDAAVRTTLHREDGNTIVKRTQDVQPILENNAVLRNRWASMGEAIRKSPEHGTFVARVPTVILEQWIKEGFNMLQATDEEIMRKLRDSDSAPWRVVPGRL